MIPCRAKGSITDDKKDVTVLHSNKEYSDNRHHPYDQAVAVRKSEGRPMNSTITPTMAGVRIRIPL